MKTKKIVLICAIILSLAMLGDAAISEKFFSYASTPLEGSSDEKVHNVELAANSINGTFMPTGSVFTFNGIVGPRTKEAGYKKAPNGRGVEVVGGGVAQVASTIYLAVKGRKNIEILEKHTYGNRFTDNYVTSTDDALMTDYNAAKDFQFQNHGKPFFLSLWFENNELCCQLEALEEKEISVDNGDPNAGIFMYSSYAHLVSFNPDTDMAYFDYFDLLQGQAAVDYLVDQEGYTKAEAQDLVDDFADSEFILANEDTTLRSIDINTVNLILMYQPSGEAPDLSKGVPSSAGDFRALYEHDSSLLLDSYFYYIHVSEKGNVYLVEQVYWP